MSNPFDRRRFIKGAALTGGTLLASGCVRRIPTKALPPPNPATALTIDVHCHIFNGTDLPIKEFIKYVFPEYAAGASLLEAANWSRAPTGPKEFKSLDSRRLTPPEAKEKLKKLRSASYDTFRKQVIATGAANTSAAPCPTASVTPPSPTSTPATQTTTTLPDSYTEFLRVQAACTTPRVAHAEALTSAQDPDQPITKLKGGQLEFIQEYFQYRYVALHDYLDLYNSGSGRSVDLMIAHMVDYDWPLADGRPPATSLDDQVHLMEKISALSEGRVHAFAPFDPLREIAFQAKIRHADWSSLDFVKRAVHEHGCIGIKLYPTMGFAPYGNAMIDPALWGTVWNSWLPNLEQIPDGKGGHANIGERLDDVLAKLYTWCLAEDIPLIAHTDRSNGRSDNFKDLTSAKHWRAVRDNFGGLRFNFGHLGDLESSQASDWKPGAPPNEMAMNAMALIDMMTNDAKAPGGHFFGDASYTDKLLNDPAALKALYTEVFVKPSSADRSVLRDHFMYGTDWNLLMREKDMGQYFDKFVSMFVELDKENRQIPDASPFSLADRFFGQNAVQYLGLSKGCRTRDRLEAFYKTHHIDITQTASTPMWLTKVRQFEAA